jgi:hypothetical protein
MVRSLLVVQVPDGRNMQYGPVLLRPLDYLTLRIECGEYVIGMVVYHEVVNGIALMATFWTGLAITDLLIAPR